MFLRILNEITAECNGNWTRLDICLDKVTADNRNFPAKPAKPISLGRKNMKDHYFFGNLDTSFINLDALVRYLRRQSFVGAIQVEFAGYMAKIVMADNGKLHVREYNQITEELTTGEKAYYRILERSKEPGGSVNVAEPRRELLNEDILPIVEGLFENETNAAERGSSIDDDPQGQYLDPETGGDMGLASESPVNDESEDPSEDESEALSDDEMRANRMAIDHDLLEEVTGELLKTIDGALDRAGLDFSAVFEKACSDIAVEYPFLDPDKRMFKYSAGLVYVNHETDAQLFPRSLGKALARVFRYLGSHPEFGKVYRFTAQRVQVLLRDRRDQFDRLFLTRQIERALGV